MEGGETCSTTCRFQAPARSNYSGLASTSHARGARPLPCPFPPEPQHDVLSTPLTSPSRVGEAKSSRRTHRLRQRLRSLRGAQPTPALRPDKPGALSMARRASCLPGLSCGSAQLERHPVVPPRVHASGIQHASALVYPSRSHSCGLSLCRRGEHVRAAARAAQQRQRTRRTPPTLTLRGNARHSLCML